MTGLAAHLLDALSTVHVAADLRTAQVGQRRITGDNERQLRARLAGALYDVLHAGRAHREGPQPRTLRDRNFEEELQAVVPHQVSPVPARVDARDGDDVVIRINRIRVRVPQDRLDDRADGTTLVRIPAVLPALSPGFLMVNGSRGSGLTADQPCLRIYLHLASAETAPRVWAAVLGRLEELAVPYRAKVVSTRSHYPRRDAMVVYLGPEGWSAPVQIAEAAAGTGALTPDLSAYVAPLSDGVGWAWEPDDPAPSARGRSFGEHRSLALADGLIAAARPGGPDRVQALETALRAARISPSAPHLNLDSPPTRWVGPSTPAAAVPAVA